MPRQTTQKLITALYPRLSHEDTLQGESNSISNQDAICQGYFHRRYQKSASRAVSHKDNNELVIQSTVKNHNCTFAVVVLFEMR